VVTWTRLLTLDRLWSWAWRPERALANLDRLNRRLAETRARLVEVRAAHLRALSEDDHDPRG